ncbi:MAG: S26 family signal peptidase [Polyangiaceae bacterium]
MRSVFRGLAWVIGLLAVLALFLYATVFDVWVVPSDDPSLTASILPTLAPGDVMLVTRRGGEPEKGNLERCADPDAPGRFVIARVAGVATDRVEFSKDVMSVNTHGLSLGSACIPADVVVENPVSHEQTSLKCIRTDSAGFSHGLLRGTEGFEEDMAPVTVDANKIYLASDDSHFHQDSRDFGQIDPATCQHFVFRLFGASGISDGSRRFTLIW